MHRCRDLVLRGAAAGLLVLALAASGGGVRGSDGDMLWWEGVFVVDTSWTATINLVSDGNGGALIVWDGLGVWIQRVAHEGNLMWGTGVQLSTTGQYPAISSDGAGGAFVAWQETSGIYVQRVNASGVVQWTSGGVRIATSGVYPQVAPDGQGGAFVAWDDVGARCGHVDSTGTPTAPGVNGIALGGLPVKSPGNRLRMIPDDTAGISELGGAIIVWADAYNDIVAQRVKNGLPWGASPIAVSTDFRNEESVEIAKDGSHGALIAWAPYYIYPAERQVRVQRINSNGNSLWTPNGVVVLDSDLVGGDPSHWATYEVAAYVASDGAGGAFVAWNDYRTEVLGPGDDDVYLQ